MVGNLKCQAESWKNEYKWPKQHQVRETCNKNSFTLRKYIVFDSPTMKPVINRRFKITWLS